ncbi:hypothetical protein LEN26_008723 [Aphanomyces euteiches]|nr:hypothetical protein LEN26_008723 [Aphanomyces euteiches]
MKKEAANDVSMAFYIGGGVLLVIAFFVRIYCRRQRRRYYSPLEVGQITLSENIARRKRDLHRYIDTLQRQLDTRKQQLEMHDHVEQVLTARKQVEDGTQDNDPTWKTIMDRGKEMYGEEWEQGKEGELPLSVLMTMHKEELLSQTTQRSHETREQKMKKTIERQNAAALVKQEFVLKTARRGQGKTTPLLDSQWKSQRKMSSAVKPQDSTPVDSMPRNPTWSKHRFAEVPHAQPFPVPRLKLNALPSSSPTARPVVSVKDILKATM